MNNFGNMTFGIEIEAEGENYKKVKQEDFLNGWLVTDDESISKGKEIKSPVMISGNEMQNEIEITCKTLKEKYGLAATKNCGAHVHIGASYLNSVSSFKRLLELWANCEKIIYIISNKPQTLPRDYILDGSKGGYSRPISKILEENLKNGKINLEEKDLDRFVLDLKNLQLVQNDPRPVKYFGINFSNLYSYYEDYDWNNEPIHTIEFRTANGTLDENVWIQNINLFGGIVKASKELSLIFEKDPKELSPEEQAKIQAWETICKNHSQDQNQTELEKLKALLDLSVPESQEKIYAKRYKENKILLEQNPSLNHKLDEKISSKPIILDNYKDIKFDEER